MWAWVGVCEQEHVESYFNNTNFTEQEVNDVEKSNEIKRTWKRTYAKQTQRTNKQTIQLSYFPSTENTFSLSLSHQVKARGEYGKRAREWKDWTTIKTNKTGKYQRSLPCSAGCNIQWQCIFTSIHTKTKNYYYSAIIVIFREKNVHYDFEILYCIQYIYLCVHNFKSVYSHFGYKCRLTCLRAFLISFYYRYLHSLHFLRPIPFISLIKSLKEFCAFPCSVYCVLNTYACVCALCALFNLVEISLALISIFIHSKSTSIYKTLASWCEYKLYGQQVFLLFEALFLPYHHMCTEKFASKSL